MAAFALGLSPSAERLDEIIFSPDGRTGLLVRAATNRPAAAVLWDQELGRRLNSFVVEVGEVNHVAFSDDGAKVIIVGGERAAVYDTARGELTYRPIPRGHAVNYSGAHVLLVGGEAGGSVVFAWNAIDDMRRVLVREPNYKVRAATWSPVINRVIVTSEENVTQIWETGEKPDYSTSTPEELRRAACAKLLYQREYGQVKNLCEPR